MMNLIQSSSKSVLELNRYIDTYIEEHLVCLCVILYIYIYVYVYIYICIVQLCFICYDLYRDMMF